MASKTEEPITHEEYEMLSDMMKKEEFRKLFFDYCEELNDPENKKLYESELTQFEKERGVDLTFINPEPGFVIKSSINGDKKCFINVAYCDKVDKPSSESHENGTNWKIPFTQAPPRNDYDKKKNSCTVYDVVFHSDTIKMAETDKRFRQLVIETALDGVQDSFNVQIDRNNLKFPNSKFKGLNKPTIIRKRSANSVDYEISLLDAISPPIPQLMQDSPKLIQSLQKINLIDDVYTKPTFKIIQRHDVNIQECIDDMNSKMNVTIPKDLVITIDLPLLRTTEDAKLDVTDKEVYLVSERPSKYKLHIVLPYAVNGNEGRAKFDKIKKKLSITLPVKQKIINIFEPFKSKTILQNTISDCNGIPIKLIEEIPECATIYNKNNNQIEEDNKSSLPFLNSTISYQLPPIKAIKLNKLQITIPLDNIDPASIAINASIDIGFQIKFYILGTGFYPIHYSLLIRLSHPSNMKLDEQILKNDALVLNFEIPFAIKNDNFKLYAGTCVDDLVEYDV